MKQREKDRAAPWSKAKVLALLIEQVESALQALGAEYTMKTQYDSTVDSMVFKMSGNRIYCYVLRKDKKNCTGRSNLVFRFRKDDHPRGWFQETSATTLAREWQGRFIRVWSEETDTPAMFREPGHVTDQLGIRVSEADMKAPDYDNTLRLYVRIAVAAAEAARLHKDRDWGEYERLTA